MPHAAILLGGLVVAGGAVWALNEFVLQPELERRRQAREEERLFEQACEASRHEYEQEERERERRREWTSNSFSSTSARSTGHDDGMQQGVSLRRRGQPQSDPFADDLEMQEVMRRSIGSSVLFDAGPSSRLDSFPDLDFREDEHASKGTTHDSIRNSQDAYDKDEEEALLETAKALSLEEYNRYTAVQSANSAPDDDLLNSPRSADAALSPGRSDLRAYTVIDPTPSGNNSVYTSRSQSPLVFTDAGSSVDTNVPTPASASSSHSRSNRPKLADETELDGSGIDMNTNTTIPRAPSPTPTLRSFTTEGTLVSRPQTPIDIRSPVSNHSRMLSPFSDLGHVSVASSIRGSGTGGGSDGDSQWSDLGEDSSSESDEGGEQVNNAVRDCDLNQQDGGSREQQEHIRQSRERYSRARLTMPQWLYAGVIYEGIFQSGQTWMHATALL